MTKDGDQTFTSSEFDNPASIDLLRTQGITSYAVILFGMKPGLLNCPKDMQDLNQVLRVLYSPGLYNIIT